MPPQYTASHQQDIPAQHEFLPGDGHRNGTEPPTLEDLYPVGEATQAEDPGNTPEISSPQPLTGADSPVQPPPPERDIEAEAAAFVAPCQHNSSRTMNACRFLLDHGHCLVLAWGDDEKLPEVYVINETGRLEVGTLLGMLTETARRYLGRCLGLDKADFRLASADARALDSAEGWQSTRKVLRAAYARLEAEGLLPEGLDVVARDFVDANLRYMGAPNGVIDLHEGRVLAPHEVRKRQAYVHAQIEDDFVPDATHPAVDIIMPEKPTSPEKAWWYKMRGVILIRTPNREIVVHMTPAGSGKTTISNGDRMSFGSSYYSTVPSSTFEKSRFGNGPSSHNSGMIKFKAPCRGCYMAESDGEMNPTDLNLVGGGEGKIAARDVAEKISLFPPTAHLIIQANVPEDEDSSGLKLNIYGSSDSTAAAALRDRLKFIPMPAIPKEESDPGFPRGNLRDGFGDNNDPNDARLRRQAWVARSVRQAVAMVGQELPPPLKTMNDLLEERRVAEGPLWVREWLPHVLLPVGDTRAAVATFDDVYQDYLRWHQENEGGKPDSRKAVGQKVKKTYTPLTSTTVNGKTTKFYHGWTLNPTRAT